MTKQRRELNNQRSPKIIDADGDLNTLLRSIKNTRIDIVTAFASKTEDLVDSLLEAGNQVTLLVGTINYFTDPMFIKFCRDKARNNKTDFSFWVDFRGNNSIHWKIYLIAPDTVIVGSSNFTSTGLSMKRDTAVAFRGGPLYKRYRTLLSKITSQSKVVKQDSPNFSQFLIDYEKQHRKLINRRQDVTLKKRKLFKLPSFQEWFTEDTAQILPIFVWKWNIPHAEKKLFRQKIQPKALSFISKDKYKASKLELHLIGSCEGGPRKAPYHDGDLILTVKDNGGYPQFEEADRVIYYGHIWWLCRLRGKHITAPFDLSKDVKRILKENAKGWFEEDKTCLDSKDLRKLANSLEGRG